MHPHRLFSFSAVNLERNFNPPFSDHFSAAVRIGQIAREYQVHPTLVTQWRKVIRDRLPELFEAGRPGQEDQGELVAQLHQKIGELTVDLDWLKKKSKQLGLSVRDRS